MRLLLMGRTAMEVFQKAYPHITVINFNTILNELSKGDPGLTIEVCTNIALKRALFDELEQVYGQVAYFGSGITADVVEDTRIPIFVQDLETPGKYQSTALIEATKKSHKKTNKVYEAPSQLMGTVVTEIPSNQPKYSPDVIVLMILYRHKEEITMPSIEEAIKNAMKELGITDADGNPLPQNTAAPKPDAMTLPEPEPAPAPAPAAKAPKTKTTKAEKRPPKPTSPKQVEAPAPTVEQPVEETQDAGVIDNIFCKLKDGQMALIFPVGLKLERKEIAGTPVDVLNVSLPDWTSTQLQALKIEQKETPVQAAAPVAVERTPIKAGKKSTAAPKPTQKTPPITNTGDEDLDSLLAQKQELTAQIAAARAAGDTQLVTELRRKRRVVRGQIHKLGG